MIINLDGINSIQELLKKADMAGYELFCDADGVLTDFDKEFEKLSGKLPEVFLKTHTENDMWRLISSQTDHFWLHMDWTPDGKKLWNFIKKFDPTILTTPAKTVPNCKEDKLTWFKREIGDVKVIVKGKKYELAHENAILIDDMTKNIDPWVEAGGIGILHTSAEKTIQELQKILKNIQN